MDFTECEKRIESPTEILGLIELSKTKIVFMYLK